MTTASEFGSRLLDVGLAGAALVCAAPVIAVGGLAVMVTTRGRIFFRQKRIGRDGVPFELYKIRTMRREPGGPGVTARGDPRVTVVGRVLRWTKFDELPSLWNVVRGDMALVGPRPELPEFVDSSDARWTQVLREKPGLTHPVTLRLRNVEAMVAEAPIDPVSFYTTSLLPYKLAGYIDYAARRTWWTDIGVVLSTPFVLFLPGRAQIPKSLNLSERSGY